MPDRSSHQGLPEDRNHGSHAARGPFSADGTSNGYGAGTAGSHRASPADGYDTGPNAVYGTPAAPATPGTPDTPGTDALGARAANAYSAGNTDALGGRANAYGAGKADDYAVRPADTYGAASSGTYGASPGGTHDASSGGTYGASSGGTYGAASGGTYGAASGGTYGAASGDPFGDPDPFGDAGIFGPRTADRFGPAGTASFAAVTAEAEAAPPVTAIGDPGPGQAADARGFLSALFDFGFTSFVTPKVIKVLYMLIVIGTVLSASIFTIIVFKASVMFGFLTLVFGDPLFILIVLAIYRIVLEFFVVTFRVSEDIRALRERGDLR